MLKDKTKILNNKYVGDISDYEKSWIKRTEKNSSEEDEDERYSCLLKEVYRGIDIIEYFSLPINSKAFTFWYGDEDGEYYSSVITLKEARELIDLVVYKGEKVNVI